MNPANTAPDPLPPPGLSWGVKRSFIDYIASLPDGSISATAGATVSGSSLFCFSPATSDYDAARGTVGQNSQRVLDPDRLTHRLPLLFIVRPYRHMQGYGQNLAKTQAWT